MKIYIPAEKINDISFDNGYGLPVTYLCRRVKATSDTIVITFGTFDDPQRSTMVLAPGKNIEYKGPYLT